MNKVEIPLSKTKIILLLLGGLAFVIAGILFTINPEEFISPIMRSPQIIRIGGITAVLFFGTASVYGIRKLFDKQMGLIIDEEGIIDNTNASSLGLIKWADIKNIKTEQVASTKFLLIYTKNPDKYFNKVKGFKRKLMESNNIMYGTPLSITSSSLECNFNDLEELINNRLKEQLKKFGIPEPK